MAKPPLYFIRMILYRTDHRMYHRFYRVCFPDTQAPFVAFLKTKLSIS